MTVAVVSQANFFLDGSDSPCGTTILPGFTHPGHSALRLNLLQRGGGVLHALSGMMHLRSKVPAQRALQS